MSVWPRDGDILLKVVGQCRVHSGHLILDLKPTKQSRGRERLEERCYIE